MQRLDTRKQDMIDEAYKQAVKVLKECASPIGFKASALDTGYNEVWGRDSMITLLGAMESGDAELIQASRASLDTLQKYQTNLGLIPNNVDAKNNEPQYRAYMDGTIWYILGVYFYFKKTQDRTFLNSHLGSVKLALSWLAHQDVDNSGLISTQEAGDWMDLFPVRGKVLYDNALYCGALKAASHIIPGIYEERADAVIYAIGYILWIHKSHDTIQEKISRLNDSVKNKRFLEDEIIRIAQGCVNMVSRPYFLAFYGFRQYGDWFDNLGNMLAILFDIADPEQTNLILDFAYQAGINSPHPARAIYPPIYPGDREWRDYFKIGNLNLPNHYHNGGIWPFIGGFYIAALTRAGRLEEAKTSLGLLAFANRKGIRGEWEFNEWLHGVSGNPLGKEKQAWSAAMYIFAYNCVKRGECSVFSK